MEVIVQKFGGSSVANTEKLEMVSEKIIGEIKKGNQVVVVVSAQGKTTDKLIAEEAEITKRPDKREHDVLVSTGEQITISKLSIMLNSKGYKAVSLTGCQIRIITNSEHTNARIRYIHNETILEYLKTNNIVVVAGFQGVDENMNITTLGRGGSDTTAVALAAALHADACEIYTDVDGVYTADPRVVPKARKLEEITYDEMLELASLGAGVLHNRSVEMAKKYGVQLVVRSSLNTSEGTIVKEESKMEKMLVSGVATDKNVAQIAVEGLENKPGVAFKLFQHLANHNVNVDMILQSVEHGGTQDISFTVTEDMADVAMETLERHANTSLKCEKTTVTTDVAKVSIVGAGMMSNAGVAAKMFEALYDAGVNIRQISTSEIRVTVLVDEKYTEAAAQAVHDAFALEK